MSKVVTGLRFQKRTLDRVNVYLDGEFAFGLPAIEAAKLKKGQVLSEADITQLRTLDLQAKALDRALHYLASRPRSEWEVRQRLKRYRSREGETLIPEQIDRVLAQLRQKGYVNDSDFAAYWVDQRNRFKPMAPRALRYELRNKGIDQRTIDAVLAEQDDPAAAALQAARKRAPRWYHRGEEDFRKKMTGFLQRRGFNWGTARDVIEQVWTERDEVQ